MPDYAGITFKVSTAFGADTATRIFSWLAMATSGPDVVEFLAPLAGKTFYITPVVSDNTSSVVNADYAGTSILNTIVSAQTFYNLTLDNTASDSDTSTAPLFTSVENIEISQAFASYQLGDPDSVPFPYFLTPDGKSRLDPARGLFHELAHAVTTPEDDNALLTNFGGPTSPYAGVEALAVAAEDLVYVQDHGGPARVGHDSVNRANENIVSFDPTAPFSDASSVSYSPSNSVGGGISGVFTAINSDGGKVEKIYGDQFHLYNFVTVVGEKNKIVGDGTMLSTTFNDALSGMLASTTNVQLDLAAIKDVSDSTLSTLSSRAAINITSGVASLNAIATFYLGNISAVIGNSNERFSNHNDADDYVGPVDPTTGNTVLGFVAGESGILIGGSGLTDAAKLTPGVMLAADNLTAFKTGSSVLLAGDGPVGGGPAMNELIGGDDTDVFVGGAGNDDIHADAGADIVIQSRGDDHVHGDGETVFAVDQAVPSPTIDTRNTSGDVTFIRDAEGGPGVTTLEHVHTFAGNATLTTFYGNGSVHELFIAGSGGGDFHLTKGDVAIGSSSAPNGNIYRISSDDIGSIGIINFGPKDKLYIDDKLFTGVDQTVTVLPRTSEYGYDGLSVNAISSYEVSRPESKKDYDSITGAYDYSDSNGEYSDISYTADLADTNNGILNILDQHEINGYDAATHSFGVSYETLKDLKIYIAGSSPSLPGVAFNYTENGQGEPLGEAIFTLYQDMTLPTPLDVSNNLTQMLSSILVDQTPDPSPPNPYSSQPSILSSSITQGSVAKQPGVTGLTEHDNASGRLDFADPDVGDFHHVAISSVSIAGNQSGSIDSTAAANWLSFGTVTEPGGSTPGSIGWTFSAPDSSFDGLSGTDSVTLTYHVQITDRSGSLASQDLTITISGPDQGEIVVRGTDGNDTLDDGGAASATLIGGLGNDHVVGHDGADTYLYTSTAGNLDLEDYSNSSTSIDTLKLTDLNASDVTFYTDRSQGEDAYIRVNATGNVIRLDRQFSGGNGSPGWGIEQVVFADGSTWNRTQIQRASWFRAGAADVRLDGYDQFDNTLAAGTGNSHLVGYGGSDTYVYSRVDGNLQIEDYSYSSTAIDTLKLTDLNASDVTFYTDRSQGEDAYIRVNATGNIIRLDRQFSSGNDAPGWGIEHVVFADGTTWNRTQIQQASWFRAGTGDVRVDGYDQFDNTLVAGTGNDHLVGYSGSDSYVYSSADGNLQIEDYSYSSTSIDTLKLTDLNASDVTFYTDRSQGEDAYIRVNATGNIIRLDRQFSSGNDAPGWGIEHVVFADGATWNRTQIQQASWFRAGAADVRLDGYDQFDNTLLAGTGNDHLVGYSGSDTYVYSRTDGNLEVEDYSTSSTAIDTLKLTDLNASDVTFYTDRSQGEDAYIRINATGNVIRLDRQFSSGNGSPGWGIEHVVFADGTTWNRTQIQQASWFRAGAADVRLDGYDQFDNTLLAGTGNDHLVGYSGSDTYVYSRTDGNLEVEDYSTSSTAIDTLKLTDLNASDVTFYANRAQDDNVYIRVNATGNIIKLDRQFDSSAALPGWGIEQVVFANGVTWGRDRIVAEAGAIQGTSGDDQLSASSGGLIYGNGGNDTITGSGAATVAYRGPSADYSVTEDLSGRFHVYDSVNGRDGYDNVGGVDKIQFADGTFTLAARQEGWTNGVPTIGDHSTAGTVVGTVAAYEPSANMGPVSYSFSSSSDDRFVIDSQTGIVSVAANAQFDAIASPNCTIQVIATSGQSSKVIPLTVDLANVADGPVGLNVGAPQASPVILQAGSVLDQGKGVYELTPAQNYEFGAVWGQIDLSKNIVWTGQLNFGTSGGDGIGFSLTSPQHLLSRTARLYGVDIPGSLGIRFTTWQNGSAGEPNNDFGQIVLNGDFSSQSAIFDTYHALPNLEDGDWHDVKISWDAASYTLSYSLDGNVIESKSYDVSTNLLSGSDIAAFGFGAQTGALVSDQKVRNLSVMVETDQPSIAVGVAPGTLVADLSGIDSNPADTLTYSLVDEEGNPVIDNLFDIVNGNQLEVKTGASVTLAAGPVYKINVKVENQDGQSTIKAISISIQPSFTSFDWVASQVDPISQQFGSTTAIGNGEYQLTPDQTHLAGNVWGTVDLSSDVIWSTRMFFGQNSNGADGIAFSLAGIAQAPLDQGGTSLGALNPDSIGFKFDTYQDSQYGDPNGSFAQFVLNGNYTNSSTNFDDYDLLPNLEDGQWHDVTIEWQASTKTLIVYLNGNVVASEHYDVVANILSGSTQASFAFGAATGDNSNDQRIQILSVSEGQDRLSVDTGSTAGTLVGTLDAHDLKSGDAISYAIVDAGGNTISDSLFEIDQGNQIRVKAGVTIEGNQGATHDLSIKATSASGTALAETVQIDIRTPGSWFTLASGAEFDATQGSDTFAMHAGFGSVTIDGFDTSSSSHDLLKVDRSVFADWAHLLGATTQVGSDLLIQADGSDVLRIKNVSLASFTRTDVRFA